MKKRIACVLMALIMLISLVPGTVLTASAAEMTTSEKMIELIAEYEGTSVTAAEMEPYEAKVRTFATTNKLTLTQAKFDALVSITYNVGSMPAATSDLGKAIINGTSGDAFIRIMAAYAITNGTNVLPGLVNRRLSEANVYLNGVYTKTPPTGYSFVMLDTDGNGKTDAAQLYNPTYPTSVSTNPTKEGYKFLGWYDAVSGGNWITTLDSTTAGKSLYPHWQADNAGAADVSYTITGKQCASLDVFQTPSATAVVIGSVKTTDSLAIVKEYIDANGVKWCQIKDSGWVKLGDVSNPVVLTTNVTVTITNSYVNYRVEPATDSQLLGKLTYGTKVIVLEVTTAKNGMKWGRFDKGWFALMYSDYDTVAAQTPVSGGTGTTTPTEPVIATAIVTCTSVVNVRGAAGVGQPQVGTYANGTKVNLYEITKVNGHDWGRTDKGWFCLDYAAVTMGVGSTGGTTGSTGSTTTETVLYTGMVTGCTNLNVRGAAGVGQPQVGTYANGTKINIYEKTTINGHDWGRTDKGWVCLDYVNLTAVSGSTGSTGSTGTTTTPAVNGYSAVAANYNTVNIRKEPGYDKDVAKTVNKGDALVISELKLVGTDTWGMVGENQWVVISCVEFDEVNFEATVESTGAVNVRKTPSLTGELNGTLANGDKVTVTEIAAVDGLFWGKIGEDKWVSLRLVKKTVTESTTPDSTTPDSGTGEPTIGTGIVTSAIPLNVRNGAGMGYNKIDSLAPGTKVIVYEQLLVGGMIWGRIGLGRWVCLSYVTMDSTGSGTGTGTGVMGTVARTYTGVNVRSAPGTGNALLGKILVGTRVEILEQQTLGETNWGRVTQGWICMDYVLLDSELPGIPGSGTTGGTTGSTGTTTPAPTAYTGVAAGAATVNIRLEASYSGTVLTTVPEGAKLNIYELKLEGTDTWGKTDGGWVCMDFIDLDPINYSGVISNEGGSVNIRKTPGLSGATDGTLADGTAVTVTDLDAVDGLFWGKIGDDKWVSLRLVGQAPVVTPPAATTPSTGTGTAGTTGTTGTTGNTGVNTYNPYGYLYTGTINGATQVNVRQTASTASAVTTTLKMGAAVVIYELAVAENMAWGRCDAGWVSLVYVDLVPYASTAIDARVVQAPSVAVYTGAGASFSQVTSYPKCTVVDIYEVNGDWARCKDGWVYTYGTFLN